MEKDTACVQRVKNHSFNSSIASPRTYPMRAGWSFTDSTIFSSASKLMSVVKCTSVMEQSDTMTPSPTA